MLKPITLGLGLWLFASSALAAPLAAEQADRLRIQAHLSKVERQLRAAPVEQFTLAARGERVKLLDDLHRYWQAGVFPRNTGHPGERRPYFIDHEGRACAVGALVIASGERTLAEDIDRRFHTDYLRDMSEPRVLDWASAHGFTVAELALIQPSYCNCDGNNGSFPWIANGGAGGAGGAASDPADYFQPVCGNNGLTYWNECIAEQCGGVTVVATGACEQAPPCELCGTGSKPVVVSECTNDAPTGICAGIDSQPDWVPVNDAVAARWLDLQQANCENPSYGAPELWQGSWPTHTQWECSDSSDAGAGGAAGRSSAGAAGADLSTAGAAEGGSPSATGGGKPSVADDSISDDNGCQCNYVGARQTRSGFALLLAALGALRFSGRANRGRAAGYRRARTRPRHRA